MTISCFDGSRLAWALPDETFSGVDLKPDRPIPISVTVTPHRPGHRVILEYRVDGGPIISLPAIPQPILSSDATRCFQAVLPGPLSGLVDYTLVLFCNGERVSPSLLSSPGQITRLPCDPHDDQFVTTSSLPLHQVPSTLEPRWAWHANYLGTLSARLQKELVGPTPDGLRINWHVINGTFEGPGLQATICPGTTDWMRIREDGIAIVDVNASFLNKDGAMIYGTYGGIFDLGPDGYQRALEDRSHPLPPVVVTPTYATASKELEWLNRCQCVGVGRVDMKARSVCFDVYRLEVGGLANSSLTGAGPIGIPGF
ncbi:MAG: DUF3237 domain-containing protein [Cyanobacteriota bacterium]|nr:DUF3237 domain-containing protein [Cyanobacteriota bacterium]